MTCLEQQRYITWRKIIMEYKNKNNMGNIDWRSALTHLRYKSHLMARNAYTNTWHSNAGRNACKCYKSNKTKFVPEATCPMTWEKPSGNRTPSYCPRATDEYLFKLVLDVKGSEINIAPLAPPKSVTLTNTSQCTKFPIL